MTHHSYAYALWDKRTLAQGAESQHANILFDLRKEPGSEPSPEVKSVSVCAARPHLMAAACKDPLVRVWDRSVPSAPITLRGQGVQHLPLPSLRVCLSWLCRVAADLLCGCSACKDTLKKLCSIA
jgi:hypothetical protein